MPSKANKPPGQRSNRKLTQQVLHHLKMFYQTMCMTSPIKVQQGPLQMNFCSRVFELYHSGNPILTVEKEGDVVLFTGGYHDKQGNPTATTRELINGVLDFLETKKAVLHSRVHLDKNTNQCYLNVQGIDVRFDAEHSWYVLRPHSLTV